MVRTIILDSNEIHGLTSAAVALYMSALLRAYFIRLIILFVVMGKFAPLAKNGSEMACQ